MAEKSLSAYVMKGMKLHWDHGTRHEDSVAVGVSDVSYYLGGNGWLELKSINKAPVRPTTPLRMSHWTEAQHRFTQLRRGWLLIRVLQPNRIYLLFNYRCLPPWKTQDEWTLAQMESNAVLVWRNRIQWNQMAQAIRMADEVF